MAVEYPWKGFKKPWKGPILAWKGPNEAWNGAPSKNFFFLRVKYLQNLQNIYMLQASFHTLSWTWCAWRIVIYMSGYMLQIWFLEFRPLLQNRASVQRPPFVGPFEFQGYIYIYIIL